MAVRPGKSDLAAAIRLAAILYPIAVGAVAVNIFFLGLMLQSIGVTAFSPLTAIGIGLVLGLPAAWIASRYLRKLVADAEAGD